MRTILILFLFSLFTMTHSLQAGRVLWLNAEDLPLFERGIEKMREDLKNEEEDMKDLFWDMMDLYVTSQKMEYDDKNMKVTVVTRARATREHNDKKACSALLSKPAKTLFGFNVKENLMEYFAEVELSEDDLLYFMYFDGIVESYGVEDTRTGQVTEIDPDIEELPKNARLLKTMRCDKNLFSDKTYYD